MSFPKSHRDAGRSIFMSSIEDLAGLLAAVAAFFGTPWLYGKTIDFIQGFTLRTYGNGWQDVTDVVWFCLCGMIVFFVVRASIGTALVLGGLAIATRFL